MTHFSGSQATDLLSTANFIVSNPGQFVDSVVRWSQSYINGGISNDTYRGIISRAGVEIMTGTSGDQVITQASEGIDRLQNMQLVELGQAIAGGAEKDIEQDQSVAALWADSVNTKQWITEINDRLSSQVVDLGQQGGQGCDIWCQIGTGFAGAGIGSIAVLGLGAVILLRS